MTKDDLILVGHNIPSIVVEDEKRAVYQMKNQTGEGVMICYTVFSGAYLIYNDFHMQSCDSVFKPDVDMFCIDHCREGRIEQDMGNGAYDYLEAGDLKIDNRKGHNTHFEFPLSHYHGITVALCMEQAAKTLAAEMSSFSIDLYALQKKYLSGGVHCVVRGQNAIKHIFSELYTVPDHIRIPYFKIKVLELLVFLDALEIPTCNEKRPYFYKTQVEKIKAIQAFITSDMQKHYTLDELSSKFDIPLTSMKTCFKGVFGTSIFAYMRTYRMNQAAVLLRTSKEASIADIAGHVGYDSPSKFAVAFKDVMGKSPLEYRKSFV
ncbi:MAG: helix-turn-helix transcriptional regulator [Syntrophomonadaceae bacterium]|nr:helix-turn-helix transcriptional regulator [Syntrophomonadaceae bacterium]